MEHSALPVISGSILHHSVCRWTVNVKVDLVNIYKLKLLHNQAQTVVSAIGDYIRPSETHILIGIKLCNLNFELA